MLPLIILEIFFDSNLQHTSHFKPFSAERRATGPLSWLLEDIDPFRTFLYERWNIVMPPRKPGDWEPTQTHCIRFCLLTQKWKVKKKTNNNNHKEFFLILWTEKYFVSGLNFFFLLSIPRTHAPRVAKPLSSPSTDAFFFSVGLLPNIDLEGTTVQKLWAAIKLFYRHGNLMVYGRHWEW